MSKILFVALALSALIGGVSVAKADDIAGQTMPGYSAAATAGSAQFADPTTGDSIRSHGNT